MIGVNSTNKASRQSYIDVLKGIAILLVIMVHFEQNYPAPVRVLSAISTLGARAPQLFFLVSAYLTWHSIGRHGISFRFYVSRAQRIFPMYFVALIVALLVPTVSIEQYSFGNIVAHFLLLHGFNPYWINTILSVGWYIGDLAIFYYICPLLKKIIKDLKSSLICLVISIVISVFTLGLYNTFFVETMSSLNMFWETFFFFHQLPVMLLGIVLHYIIEKFKAGEISVGKTLFIHSL